MFWECRRIWKTSFEGGFLHLLKKYVCMRICIKRLVMVDLLSKHCWKKNNYPRFFSLSYPVVPLKHPLDISINQQTTTVVCFIALILLQMENKSKQVRVIFFSRWFIYLHEEKLPTEGFGFFFLQMKRIIIHMSDDIMSKNKARKHPTIVLVQWQNIFLLSWCCFSYQVFLCFSLLECKLIWSSRIDWYVWNVLKEQRELITLDNSSKCKSKCHSDFWLFSFHSYCQS